MQMETKFKASNVDGGGFQATVNLFAPKLLSLDANSAYLTFAQFKPSLKPRAATNRKLRLAKRRAVDALRGGDGNNLLR